MNYEKYLHQRLSLEGVQEGLFWRDKPAGKLYLGHRHLGRESDFDKHYTIKDGVINNKNIGLHLVDSPQIKKDPREIVA
jgi:hypothetical protein